MSFQWCSKLFPYCCWYFLIVVISYCHLLQLVDICCFVLILLVICWFRLYLLLFMWKAISFLCFQYFDIIFVGYNSVCIDLWIFLMFVHIRWYFKYHVLSVPGRPPEASSQPAANQYPVHDPEVYPEVYPEVCSEGYPAGRVMGQGRFRTIAGPIQATSLLIFVVLCLYLLKYLMMCVNSCWYLFAFNDIYIFVYICWYLLIFIDNCLYLLIFIDIW